MSEVLSDDGSCVVINRFRPPTSNFSSSGNVTPVGSVTKVVRQILVMLGQDLEWNDIAMRA